ncbi:hypothetical protein M758_9G142700 [Ceratodon purpureus]|nr:hypothetical protein M758_9G142700 [Ceratodon purpureus]
MAQASMGMRVAKAVPAVAIGVLTGALLMRDAEEATKMLGRGCPDRAAYSWRSNVAVLDKLLCVLVNFFVYGVRSDEGKVVTGYTGTLLVSVMAFMAVEGSRLKSGLFLSATWLHGILLQITGVSVSFPAVWLPTYFLYDGGNREHSLIWRKKISLARVAAIAVAFLFLWLFTIALFFPLNTDKKQTACLLFLAMPCAVTMAYLPFQTTQDAPQQKGHKGVIALHLLQAGFGLTWHLVAILFLLRDQGIPGRLVQLFTSFRNEEWPVYFLLIDFVSLFLSFLYLTAVEEGVFIALLGLVGGVLFGPAFAVSAYCVYREQCISKAVSRVRNKTKEN